MMRTPIPLLLCFALLAPLPGSAQAIPDHPSKLVFKPLAFEVPKAREARIKLKNGVTAYLVEDPTGQPLVDVSVLIRGGAHLEPAGKEGLAGLHVAVLRSGGTLRTPADKLDARLDYLAAQLGAGLGRDQGHAVLNLNALAKDSREGLELLAEVLREPAFAQDRLDLAKRNARQGIERRNDDTTGIERYQLELLLRGEGYFTTRFATAASLEGISRDDLLAFHQRLLHPDNLIVAVSGRFDRTAMTALLNATLGELKAASAARRSPPIPPPSHTAKPGIFVTHKDVNQGRVSFALPGLKRADPDWTAVEVMNFLLGGDFTSRMVMKIRTEEGLAYSVGTRFTPGMAFPGDFRGAFQTKTRTVAYGLRLALAELAKMRDTPVTDEELARAKGAIIDGFPARFSSSGEVADLFQNEDYQGGAEDYWAQYRAKVQAVTKAEIQRVARKYLDTAKLVILCVGHAKDMEAGDPKDHPGLLKDTATLPLTVLPLRDPLTMQLLK